MKGKTNFSKRLLSGTGNIEKNHKTKKEFCITVSVFGNHWRNRK